MTTPDASTPAGMSAPALKTAAATSQTPAHGAYDRSLGVNGSVNPRATPDVQAQALWVAYTGQAEGFVGSVSLTM